MQLAKRGRPKGTGYKSQGKICLALTNGSKSFQDLVDVTGLHRNTIAGNLKVLQDMNIVGKQREGRKMMYYSIDEGAEAYASFVMNPNWQRELREAIREFQWDKRIEAAMSLVWLNMAKKYQREIREMQSTGYNLCNIDIFEVFAEAKMWRDKEKLRNETSKNYVFESESTTRRNVEKLRVDDLIQFAKAHPEIVKEYREIVKKKLRDL
jgi:DNA-binding transcriptional ArsR family regulator